MTKPRKQLIIKVTAKDIGCGIPRSCASCPIVMSLRRRYPGEYIELDYENCYIGGKLKFFVTGKMEQWMSRFDNGHPASPTAFFVDAAV